MTDREQFEIIRQLPIALHTVAPEEIECNETSDKKVLCDAPLVSVCMITYNHGAYIRDAIDGVVMQKTDFPFELVIGEDCSQDDTRRICFEYQRKYPDKIRVLWSSTNVFNKGSNDRRTFAHCRGKYIAICEGDDYWTDPLKLQKQVSVMEQNPTVGLCFCGAIIQSELEYTTRTWNEKGHFKPGFITGEEFFIKHCFGRTPSTSGRRDERFIMTATTLVKAAVLKDVMRRYEIFLWRLSILDSLIWLAVSAHSDVYYIPDIVSVYRQNMTGACGKARSLVWIDGQIARAWFYKEVLGRRLDETTTLFRGEWLLQSLRVCMISNRKSVRNYLTEVLSLELGKSLFGGIGLFPVRVVALLFPFIRIVRSISYYYVVMIYAYVIQPSSIRESYLSIEAKRKALLNTI